MPNVNDIAAGIAAGIARGYNGAHLALWAVFATALRVCRRGLTRLRTLPGDLRSRRRRKAIADREFDRLRRAARVPDRPGLVQTVRNPKVAMLHARARRKTLAQLREIAYGGRTFPTTLTVADPTADAARAAQAAQTTPTTGGPVGLDPDTATAKGTHANRVRSPKEGARQTAAVTQALKAKPKKTGKSDRLTVTPYEQAFSDSLVDAMVRPPKGSTVQKVDTRVRGYWETNPNTTEKVQEAVQVPIVASQIRTVIKHLISAGAQIQGAPYLVKRLEKWFDIELELQTGHDRGLDRFVTDVAKQLLFNGSGVVFRQRTLSSQTRPFKHPVTGALTPPVWGYAVPDMATVECFVDDEGRPRRWRQNPGLYYNGESKEYPDTDAFLARIPTQNSSLYFWTPSFVLPSLYAINVLREVHSILEAHTEALVDIPYYITVGDKDFLTGQVTKGMVDDTRFAVDDTPRGGTLVVPWYVKINRVDVEDYLEPLLSVADFWGTEVRRGIGGSQLADGDGSTSNRNTADSLDDRDMLEAGSLVPEIARAFRFVAWEKLWEWAEAGEFKAHGIASAQDLLDQATGVDDLAYLVFTEIDLAEQVRRETHALNKFQSGATTHKELREELGHNDGEGPHAEKYWFDIQAELAEKAEAQKIEGQQALLKSKANPSNQHGTQTKPKRASNS